MALSLYYQMIDYGLAPDNFTYPFVLKACSHCLLLIWERDIHENVKRTGWEVDVFVGAALIDMYAKCGCVDDSRHVFDKIMGRDVVLWNPMLAAYSQNGHPEECLALCGEMAWKGLRPTDATLVTAISALLTQLHCGKGGSFMGLVGDRGITQREIIIRDVNRYHHFNGVCSCGDYW